MKVGERVQLRFADQEQVHHFSVIWNQRSPVPRTVRINCKAQDGLRLLEAYTRLDGHRFVKEIVSVVAVVAIPPRFSEEQEQGESNGTSNHRPTRAPAEHSDKISARL